MELMPTEIYARMSERDAEFCFFADLKKDELARETGAEGRIKHIMNRMKLYVSNLNEGLFSFEKKVGKDVGEARECLESVLKKMDGEKCIGDPREMIKKLIPALRKIEGDNFLLCKPIGINFADASGIAYVVGTYRDERGLLRRKFLKAENPIENLIEEYEAAYDIFREKGDITQFDRGLALEIERVKKEGKDLCKEMLGWAEEYLDREFSLARLAEESPTVQRVNKPLRVERTAIRIVSVIKPEATDLLRGEEPLGKREVEQLADYFYYQKYVNEMFFRAIYLHCLREKGLGDKEATKEINRVHEGLEKEYTDCGFISMINLRRGNSPAR